jgi:hypothetical protein
VTTSGGALRLRTITPRLVAHGNFSSTHNTDRVRWGIQVQPDHLADSRLQLGSVENLKVSVCQGLTSCSAQTLATVLWLMSSSAEARW